jgi:hypothetical protein
MSVRRLVVAFAVLIAGPAAWAASAEPASAGGPTSVLLSNPVSGRVGALYRTQRDYQRLVDLLDADGPAKGGSVRPASIPRGMSDAYRLTWMIHDMTVWRIDQIYESGDGLLVQTLLDPAGDGDPFAAEGRWTQLRRSDKDVLSSVLRDAGVLGESAVIEAKAPAAGVADPAPGPVRTTSAAGTGLIAAGTGLAGLIAGAGGTLLLRRARTRNRPPRAVLTG